MKIGTLTFHRASNYGGVLQCYALVHFLREKGYDAEVLDYHSKAIDDAYKLVKMGGIRKFVGSLLRIVYTYKSNRNFKKFRDRYIYISRKSYYKTDDFDYDYDVLIIGSDQVWSKRINKGLDPFFWGQIIKADCIISYAASMGTDHAFTEIEKQKIGACLNNFNAISVREDSLAQELKTMTSKPIMTVIDPTLLLSFDDYRKIAHYPKASNYVLYYQMEYHPQSKYRVQEIAQELNCSIVVIGGKKEAYEVDMHYYNASSLTPSEFIGYILNAKCVLTSSFHGTALSIAMKKDFYFFANYETDRAANLLKHIGAIDRMVISTEPLSFSQVDYNSILPQLNQFKKTSEDFLLNSINNTKSRNE